MDLDKLISSERYKDALRRVAAWKGRLETADRAEAMRVREENAAFFTRMRESDPELYSVFQLSDKELSEMIFKRMTGKDITID